MSLSGTDKSSREKSNVFGSLLKSYLLLYEEKGFAHNGRTLYIFRLDPFSEGA